MPIYDLIKYSNNYTKISAHLQPYHKDHPVDNITSSESFKFKSKLTGRTPVNGKTEDAEITITLQNLSNFWRFLKMPFINCDVSLMLTQSALWPRQQVQENFL